MAKMLARYRQTNQKDTLCVQYRQFGPLRLIMYGLSRCFVKGIPNFIWTDFTDLRNKQFLIKQDLNWHASEIERLYAELKAEEEFVKSEIKSIEKDANETRGYSRPFYVDKSRLGPIGLKFKDPGDAWKKTVNPKLYGGQRKTASGKDIGDGKIPGGFNTTYTLDDFSQHKMSIDDIARERGSDGAVIYRSDKGKGGGGNVNFNNRKKQSGETPEGHQARLRALKQNEDMSNWTLNQDYP